MELVKCSLCGGDYYVSSYSSWFGHVASEKHQFALALEKLNNEVELFNKRMQELGDKTIAMVSLTTKETMLKNITDAAAKDLFDSIMKNINTEVPKLYPPFGWFGRCPKCNTLFTQKTGRYSRLSHYKKENDLMECTCQSCEYSWFERPADQCLKY